MPISKSAKLFRERARLVPTRRYPAPTWCATNNAMRNVSLKVPLPIPAAVSNGDPPPDRGLTKEPWPHGTDCSS